MWRNMININFDAIRERDVDLVIMREFFFNNKFIDLFLRQINFNENYFIESINHSVMDTILGESDIEIIMVVKDIKIALLIENKIDATEQPQQYERYVERGKKKKRNGEITEYYVFMTASKQYLLSHNQYPYKVSYENMLDNVSDNFSKAIISKAINKTLSIPKRDLPARIILAKVKNRNLFDKEFKYNSQTLDFDNLERCRIDTTPTTMEDAHRHLWDYIKQLRGKPFKRPIPMDFLSCLNANISYDKNNSQFIEGEGYNDVAWVDCGDTLFVMFREVDYKSSGTAECMGCSFDFHLTN